MRPAEFVLLTVTVFAPACFAQDPSRGVNFYSVEKEKALGEQLAREYRARATPLDNPETLARIEAIGRSLVPAGSPYSYSFALVADDTALHEPVAFPGGFLFVPKDLLDTARNRDELAGMIAHAIAHVEARHGTKQATREQLAAQAALPLVFLGGWQARPMPPNAAPLVPLGMIPGIRAWELAADLLATRFMAAAGYDPARLADYIERVQPPDATPPDPRSVLPARAERVAALRNVTVR